jgi:ComEC/Rec2-related protein
VGRFAGLAPLLCVAVAAGFFLLALVTQAGAVALVFAGFVLLGAGRAVHRPVALPIPEGIMIWDVDLLGPVRPSGPQAAVLRAAWSAGPHRVRRPLPRWIGALGVQVYGLGEATGTVGRSGRMLARGRLATRRGRGGEPLLFLDGGKTLPEKVPGSREFQSRVAASAFASRWLAAARASVARTIDRQAPGELNALFKALALGDRSGLGDACRESFARTGTAHLLAISGLHIGLLGALVFSVARRAFRRVMWLLSAERAESGWGDTLPAALGVLAAAGYVALASGPLSGRRALAMLALYMLARRMLRGVSAWNILGGAAGLVLFCDPAALTELGLQLSVVSVAGLLLVSKGRGSPPGWPQRALGLLRGALLASAATVVATAPLCAMVWGRVPLSGLWVNVPAIALLGTGTVPPLLVGCLLGALHPAFASPFFALAELCSTWGLVLIEAASAPRWSPIVYWQPSGLAVIGAYSGAAVLLVLVKWPRSGRSDAGGTPGQDVGASAGSPAS